MNIGYNQLMDQIGSPIPYREETWLETLSRKVSVTLPGVVNKSVGWLIEMITKVLRFIFNLIPEALGRR